MKTVIRAILFMFVASVTLVGCGKDNNGKGSANNVQCDAFGNCYTTQPGYNPYTGYSKDTVILEGGVTLSNRNAWKDLLDGLYNCRSNFFGITISTCGLMDSAAPRLNVVLNDYLFRGGQGSSAGSVKIFSTQIPGALTYVNWYQIDNNTAFDTQVLLPYAYNNKFMRVKLTGLSTDAYIPVELYYGNDLVGTGQLVRMNH